MPPDKLKDGSTLLPDHAWHWRNYAFWAYLQRLKRSDAPIFVGPWRGEVGFEALYWIPFIEQLVFETGIPRERFVPISRGGAAAWYGMPTGFELYALRTPQQIRVENRKQVMTTGLLKQDHVSDFDRAIVRDAADASKVTRYHMLHPAWMYTRLAPFWTLYRGLTWLNPQLRFATLPAPALPDHVTLPEDFVAVRFYSRSTFPGRSKQINAFMAATLHTIQQDLDVVVLDTELSLDDHMDLTLEATGPRLHHLSEYVTLRPENTLSVMSAVVTRARGFVGTYGGFAQLALRLGRPSVSFYQEWEKTSIAHAQLAQTLAIRSGMPSHVLRIGDVPMLNTILPEARVEAVPPSKLLQPA